MTKPTGPLPNQDRLSQIDSRLAAVEAQVRQLVQIVKGDADLRLPALADAPATIESLEGRLDALEKLVESIKDGASEPADDKSRLDQFLLRNESWVKVFTAVGVALAAGASIIAAARGQPPVVGGP